MHDRHLEQLLHAAHEADAFEAEALGRRTPVLRLTEAGPEEREALLRAMSPERAPAPNPLTRFSSWGWRAGLAAAACITLGWFLSASFTNAPGPVSDPAPEVKIASGTSRFRPAIELTRPRAVEPMVSLVSHSPDSEEVACVLLAIFRDSRGGCACIHLQPHTIDDGRSVEDIAPDELASIRLHGTCGTPGDSLLLVAMEGPGYLLPHTAAQAEALADCVGDARTYCDGSPSCMASMAAGCIDPSVKVVAHSVQMASR